MSVVVIGASSGPGRLLFDELRASNIEVIGIARSAKGIKNSDRGKFIRMDAMDTDGLLKILPPETCLIHCSRPEILTALLQRNLMVQRLIVLGSTRIYTRFPDDKCKRLAAMSHELSMSDLKVTLLHPTMIVGAPGLNNIERIVNVARVSPIIPLPGDGASTIQPVEAADVVQAVLACMSNSDTIGKTIVLAGHGAITYRQLIEICVDAAGLKCKVVNLPYPLVWLLSILTPLAPGIPTIGSDEVQRLLEDKDFDIEDMLNLLGVKPKTVEVGIRSAIENALKKSHNKSHG